MSHVIVTNSFAKTFKIPTTPTKYLTEVRDEACEKFGVSKSQFTLKYVGCCRDFGLLPDRTLGTTINPSRSLSKSDSQTCRKAHD